MLPRAPKPTAITSSLTSAHGYVDFCIFDLARQFDALGVNRSEIQVKLFGGADVLAVENPAVKPTVGRLNCETAVEVLREEGYGVTASSLGGNAGLKISFNTGSGEVLLLRLT
jgi:chemotaxis protein CheD